MKKSTEQPTEKERALALYIRREISFYGVEGYITRLIQSGIKEKDARMMVWNYNKIKHLI
jgi:hypothetical protein